MPDSIDFKTMLDNQTLPVEFAGKQPIDMKTYYNLFGVNRVPGEPKDSLIFNPNSKHIIVAHNKNVSFVIKFFCLSLFGFRMIIRILFWISAFICSTILGIWGLLDRLDL